MQSSSTFQPSKDERPIRASGHYNIRDMNLTGAGEDTIMGETLNTMEMTSAPYVNICS